MTDPATAPLSDDALDTLTAEAQHAVDDPSYAAKVPAQTILALVRGFRHFRDEATSAICGEVENGDVLADVAHRLTLARAALRSIAAGDGAVRLRATAKAALLRDDDADRSMRGEFEYGLVQVVDGSRARCRLEREPSAGEHRRDRLGNVWAVEYGPDDEERETVRLHLVRQSDGAAVDDLMSTTERVAKRARGRRAG